MNDKISEFNKEENNINENININQSDSSNKKLASNTIKMAAATLFCRFSGLFRVWAMAFALGNTTIASSYNIANTAPNIIFDLVAGGLMGAAFIPILMKEKKNFGEAGANKFSCNILNICILVMGVLSILSIIAAPVIIFISTFTVNQHTAITEDAIFMFKLFAFQILFYGIGSVLNAILNAKRIYFLPALAPAINNVIVIISFMGYAFAPNFTNDTSIPLLILGLGTTLGVAVQALIQIPVVFKSGFKWQPILNFNDPALREAIKIAIPTIIYAAGMIVAYNFRMAFSLYITDIGPATITFAWTWFQLPYGIIAVSLSRTLFTEMSEAFACDNIKLLKKNINLGISLTLVLIIPLAVLICVFGTSLVSLLKAGKFQADDVSYVGMILSVWAVALPAYSIVMYFFNVFASIKKFTTFAVINTITVIGQCVLYYVLCKYFNDLLGIPISDIFFYTLVCIILFAYLKKYLGKLNIIPVLIKGLKVTFASVCGSICGFMINEVLKAYRGDEVNIITGITELCVGGLIGLVIIFIICWIIKVEEVRKFTNIGINFCKKFIKKITYK